LHAKHGNYKLAYNLFTDAVGLRDSLNNQQFYEQINEFRTLYELDKAELETERQMAKNQRLRSTIIILSILGFGLLLIIGLVLWNRKKILEKNRGLFNQIKEQDRLTEELQQLRAFAETHHADTDNVVEIPDVETGHALSLQNSLLIAKIQDYMLRDKNFADPDLDVEKLVKTLKISRTYLYQKVKEATGQTINDYINTLRLEEARRLLGTTNGLIETIAEMCGYNKSTFYRLFREKYNMTPTMYKKMCKEEQK